MTMPLILLVVGLYLMWQRGTAAPHTMSPTAVFITLILALLIDWSSLGPNSLRDRIAFALATPAIREGFDGSPADQWTVGRLREGVQALLDSPPVSGSYLAGASINVVIGAMIGLTWLYAVLCMLPPKMSKKLGRAATLSFPPSAMFRLNLPLWAVAIILGLMADLPAGAIGVVCRASIDMLIGPITWLVVTLFGAA